VGGASESLVVVVVVVLEYFADWCWQALLLEDDCDELWRIAMLLEYDEVLKYLKLSSMYPCPSALC
jgi:hypothetical protein